MVGKKTVTLLSLLVLLMLVSGEEELIRVKRLHNDEPALSSKPIIQPPAGGPLQGQPDKGHPLLKTITLQEDDDPLREASPNTKGDPAMQNPVKPSSSETVVGRMKRRIRRMAEDASLLKRGITHHFLGRDDDSAVIEEERLKREKRQRG